MQEEHFDPRSLLAALSCLWLLLVYYNYAFSSNIKVTGCPFPLSVEPPPMVTSLQQPFFLSQITVHTLTPNKNLNLFSKMATSL